MDDDGDGHIAEIEILRTCAASEVPDPAADPTAEPEWDLGLIDRAINGVDLPDYPGVPDSAAPAAPPTIALRP